MGYYFPVRLSDVCLSLCQTLLLLVRHGCANRGGSHDEYQCSVAVSGVGGSDSKHPGGGKNRLLSSLCPAEEEEGGMKGKLSPNDLSKGSPLQSKDTWDALGGRVGGWGCGEAHNPGAIVIKKKGGLRVLRSTEQSTLTLATVSAQCLPSGENGISMNWEVWFSWASCGRQRNRPIRDQAASTEV